MLGVEERPAVKYQEPLIVGDYVERRSSEQLLAEALNSLGLNLKIRRKDLVRDGVVVETGGVEISGTRDEIEIWDNLLNSPKVTAIRLAEGGWEIEEDYLPEASFDPKTEAQVHAYSLHWQAIRSRRSTKTTYLLNNSQFVRDMSGIRDPEAHEAELKEWRDHKIEESHQITKEARKILGGIKPLGRSDLIAIFQQEAKTLYPNLAGNLEP